MSLAWVAFQTIFVKEVRRFTRIWVQTLVPPVITMTLEGIQPDDAGNIGPIQQINALKEKGYPLAYVGDVVGTGSSRKSATNSVLWFMGKIFPISRTNVPAAWC
ncbi:hypothetical protein Z012_10090 [Avibacterium paragallinarum]|nr:hypothetical protein Z012_10090 [Avibacterium paragallinarum]